MASAAHTPSHRLIRILVAGTGVLVAAVATMIVTVALNLRDEALINAQANLKRHSLTLAGQAERSIQPVDLILSNITDYLDAQGVIDSASFKAAMSGWETHAFLKGKLVGLPQLDAIAMVDAQGRLINSSRSWPVAELNVSERDYFRALTANPELQSYVGAPEQNPRSGSWDLYTVRRVNTPTGGFAGLVLAGISLQYFQDFYRSISLEEGSAISLLRDDGYLLARYPQSAAIGRVFKAEDRYRLLQAPTELFRERSPIDQAMRIGATRRLAGKPVIIIASQTEDSILAGWRKTVQLLAVFGGGMILLLVMAAFVIVRKWRQQELLAKVRAEKAEAEKAKALAETELLREQERAADAASRMKSNFLAMMSHESAPR